MKHKKRCFWVTQDPVYIKYHDEEWGVPVYDDKKQFEFLILEGAQAGLSWLTILKRRENYRNAFCGFDPRKVSRFNKRQVEKLIRNSGIIRNRLKIESAVTNARAFLKVQKEFGSFSRYLWSFVGNKPVIHRWKSKQELPARSELSDAISKDLKKRGFKFVGSTIIYAHLQALGLVFDHTRDCFCYKKCRIRPSANVKFL